MSEILAATVKPLTLRCAAHSPHTWGERSEGQEWGEGSLSRKALVKTASKQKIEANLYD